jgi:(4S)-4-hydroxy-5-phosphonooxypentane-2,3-dione isomerase
MNMRTSLWQVSAAIFFAAAAILPLPPIAPPAGAETAGPFINAVDLDIVPAELEKYLAAIKENAAATVKEPGCRQFDILVLNSNPNHIFLYEVYDSEAAFLAHRASEHFKNYMAITGQMVAKRDARPMSPIAFNARAK